MVAGTYDRHIINKSGRILWRCEKLPIDWVGVYGAVFLGVEDNAIQGASTYLGKHYGVFGRIYYFSIYLF